MIYRILTQIRAVFNLLCLVNIQAWQLASEGCWWKPLPRVQKMPYAEIAHSHRGVRQHGAASVGWKPVNMHLVNKRWDDRNTHLVAVKTIASHVNCNRCLQRKTRAKRWIKAAQVMKINKNLHRCFEDYARYAHCSAGEHAAVQLNPE